MSSLPTRVDIEDWLDEDLPAVVDSGEAAAPNRVGFTGLPASYPSVVSGDELGDLADGPVFALVARDDEYLHELVGVAEIAGTSPPTAHLIEQSESMNFPV